MRSLLVTIDSFMHFSQPEEMVKGPDLWACIVRINTLLNLVANYLSTDFALCLFIVKPTSWNIVIKMWEDVNLLLVFAFQAR